MKRIIILTLALLLASSFVAADFNIQVTSVKKDIFLSEYAEFNVTISNLLSEPDVLTFSTQDPTWVLLNQQFNVPAESSKTFTFRIDPSSDIQFGYYQIPIKIKSARSGQMQTQIFDVNVRPYDPIFGEYRPSIQFGVTIDKEVDPRKKVPVKIFLKNRNALDVGSVEIRLESDLFEDTKVVSLGPLEEKRIEYLYKFDSLQNPGIYSLDAGIYIKNISVPITSDSQNYEVMAYSLVTRNKAEKNFLFKKDEIITLENLGNGPTTQTVTLQMNWLERLFSSSDPKAVVVQADGSSALSWEVTLDSQELKTINVSTNYRIPIGILILIAFLIVLYFIYRSPLVLSKEAFIIDQEEGSQYLKIRLFLKNRTRKTIENTYLTDRVPGIAEIVKKKTLGTLEPEKITKHERKGTVLKWNLETLEPFEERIVTYEIKSRLKIIGNVSLPSCKAKFVDRKKEKLVYSNKIMVINK